MKGLPIADLRLPIGQAIELTYQQCNVGIGNWQSAIANRLGVKWKPY
jgi:hypothetical protein